MDQKTRADLRSLEESLWRAETRFDDAHMEAVFAPDFLEFGRSGRIYTRDEVMAVQNGLTEINVTLPLQEFRARYLAKDVVQVTYVSETGQGDQKELANRSSIWSRDTGGWKLRFHQGTPA